MNRLKLVIIPGWIEAPLAHAKKPLSTLLHPTQLLSTISRDDVSFYLYCHDLFIENGFKGIVETMRQCDENVFLPYKKEGDAWYLTGSEGGAQKFSYMNTTKSLRPLVDGEFIFTEGGNELREYVFDCVDIDEGVIGIRLVGVLDGQSYMARLHASYEKLLGLMNKYLPFNELASTPAFSAYVALAVHAD